jgi:general stress protein YciG
MAGTQIGGQRAAAKNLAKDPNFYAKIGARGGKNGRTGGFASQVVGDDGLTGAERARIAGARGGRISRRKKVVTIAVQGETSQEELTLAA